jgi:hypothetical protein
VRMPNWLYACLLDQFERNMRYGIRPRFMLVMGALFGLLWWLAVLGLRAIGILQTPIPN